MYKGLILRGNVILRMGNSLRYSGEMGGLSWFFVKYMFGVDFCHGFDLSWLCRYTAHSLTRILCVFYLMPCV